MPGFVSSEREEVITAHSIIGDENFPAILTGTITYTRMIGTLPLNPFRITYHPRRECGPFSSWEKQPKPIVQTLMIGVTIIRNGGAV